MTGAEDERPEILGALVRDLAAGGKVAELPVRGYSMRPLLRDGDRVRVLPIGQAPVSIGDIVLVAAPIGPVIHRVVGRWPAREGWLFLTKGDGAYRLDAPVRAERLVGRIVTRVREGQLQQLGTTGMRFRARCRAVASLLMGLIVEATDRATGRARSRHSS